MERQNQRARQDQLPGITFARSMCAVGIILFHYACHTQSKYKLLLSTRNGGWGSIIVTTFFAISGLVLYHNYPRVPSLRVFYYKRWKSIFPAFYLCFIYFFLRNAFDSHMLFYGPEPQSLVFSAMGLDGYLLYRYPNYYIVGEWFLGAIILLYLLYPLLAVLMEKTDCRLVLLLLVTLELIVLNTSIFTIDPFRNLLTCLVSFYAGMLIKKYSDLLLGRVAWTVSLALFIVLALVRVSLPMRGGNVLITQVQGLLFLPLLYGVGSTIMCLPVSRVFSALSRISFPIFLLQHRVVLDVQGVCDPVDLFGELLAIVATVMLTMTCAKVLAIVTDAMLNSRPCQKLEKAILRL